VKSPHEPTPPGSEERSIPSSKKSFPADKTLSQNEELFRAVLENAMEGILIMALDGRLLYCSPSIEAIMGYSREEAMKLSMFSLLHPEDLPRAMERVKWAVDHAGIIVKEEFRVKHKDGTWRQLEVVAKNEFFQSFNEQAMVLNYRDISERKKTQQAAERLSLIVQTSNDAIFTLSREGAILSWNPSAREIYGYPGEEISGRHFSILMAPAESEVFQDNLKAVLSGKNLSSFLANHLTHSGRPLSVSLTLSPIRETTGEIHRVSVIARDISGLQQYVETAKHLSSLLENAPDAIISNDLNGKIILWNKGAEELFGYRAEEIIGCDSSLLQPDEKSDEQENLRKRVISGDAHRLHYEARRRHKNGTLVDVEFRLFAIRDAEGKMAGVTGIGRDITKKLRAEKILAESEIRFRRIFEKSPLGMCLGNPDGIMRMVNPKFCEILGYEPGELIDRPFSAFTYPEDVTQDLESLQSMVGGEFNSYETEKRYIHKDGHVIWVHLVVTVLGEKKSDNYFFLAMVEDITEKTKAKEVSKRLSMILEHTPYGIISEDLNGIIRDWNKAAEKMFGYRTQEIIGQTAAMLAAPEKEKEQEGLWERVRRGETVTGFETLRRRKNGEIFDVTITLSPVKDPQGQVMGMAVIVRDISDMKKAEKTMHEQEERLLQSQKMDAIGRLAGGVAHDFNNLLSVIGANTGFILTDPEPQTHREELEEIDKAVKRGAELTRQLLLLGQKQVSQAHAIQLNDLCWEMSRMIKRLFDASIELVMDLDPGLKPIYADPAQIQQVILNLVLNAQDAMPKGGRLTIQTRNETSEAGEFLPGFSPWVKLSVLDTGTGIDPEIQKHVYEPFFTTKKGKGTGLGLTTVYGIVKQWKGQIQLRSSPGEGTVFSLFFPIHAVEAEAKIPLPRQGSLIPNGKETILVVEDEAPVRKAIVRTLNQYGYKVLEACDGMDAIQGTWNYKEEIHLLVTDTVMPRINGRHLAEELSQSRPKMKVLFISGYPRDILSQKGEIDPGIRLLAKPFAMEDLAREVRQVLDEKKG